MGDDTEEETRLRLPLLVTTEDLRICIRPVTPADRDEILKGLRSISAETTYRRFFVSAFSPSEQTLRYLTEVDGQNHVALGALDCTTHPPRGVGVARYVRLPEEPTVAEAAIVVIDEYQGHGVGSLLLAALNKHAAGNGVETFRGYVLKENTGMIEHLRALGASESPDRDGILQFDTPVYAHRDELPEHPRLQRARWAWERVARAEVGDCEGERE